ncbi:MAG: hypothetical protein TH68_03655 [Candidatus Synechococcus spongiarum 142]|uniref:Uncharacterized protein n=1 Tax=Candidatus Synechococcus spongiarum 142 TaxID=1608213 RepID=A0A6N3X917_9SYNE|nr:MAG: hypothetical protein TH68_03655 [Candidatus Synechococcus spongiarum 142]
MVTLLFLGLAAFVWSKSRRNGDEVIATFEVLLAAMLLVLALCYGRLHLPLACILLVYALLLPRYPSSQVPGRSNSHDDIFVEF